MRSYFIILLGILLLCILRHFKRQIQIPIYISLTSIFKNQEMLFKTLQSLVNQTLLPNKIFLYLSEEPSFFDNGFRNKIITNKKLLHLLQTNQDIIQIKWGKDIGPYGKLIPLLKEKWNEDCIIITVDDDTIYDKNLIENLVVDYIKHQCVISYRGFTPKLKDLKDFNYEKRQIYTDNKSLYNFPTGKGAILYKPEFFHKTGDLIFNKDIYTKYCSAQDDIWFYLVRIKNGVKCFLDTNKKWFSGKKPTSSDGLWVHFNKPNDKGKTLDTNTLAFRNAYNKIFIS
jgi:hypothetical protein